MNARSWLASVTVGAALTATAFATAPEGWSTDYDQSLAKAKAEKKPVLIEFTGSDWCPVCIVMRKNVFSKKDFVAAASKKYILVEIDFPKADKALSDKNERFTEKYKLNDEPFPIAVLLTPEGKEFSRFNAGDYPTPELFLKHLDAQLKKMDLD